MNGEMSNIGFTRSLGDIRWLHIIGAALGIVALSFLIFNNCVCVSVGPRSVREH